VALLARWSRNQKPQWIVESHCGFALLMYAFGVRSSSPDAYAGAGQGDVTDVTTNCML